MSGRAVQSLRHFLRKASDDAAIKADGQLLRQFVDANDHRAFEVLLDRHGPMVLGTARRLVNNAADADDVFQAVFLSLARLAKSIRRGQSVPNWLYTTTCRIAARARRRRAIPIEHAPEPGTATAAETDLAWREVRTALDEELQRLPERLRLPLLLCYLSGLTRDEAAEQLGWSRRDAEAATGGRAERACAPRWSAAASRPPVWPWRCCRPRPSTRPSGRRLTTGVPRRQLPARIRRRRVGTPPQPRPPRSRALP